MRHLWSQIITSGLEQLHKKHLAEHAAKKGGNVISGANTPYFDAGKFYTEDSDHCPRTALYRALGLDTLLPKNPDDQLSHHTGRMWESLVKIALKESLYENSYVEEYEHRREFDGGISYVGHEDFKVTTQGKEFLVETKTLQSANPCEQIKDNEKPKLGALLQLIPALSSSGLPFGYISYACGSWFENYSFATKKRNKYQPFRKEFYVTYDKMGRVYVEEKATPWTVQGVDAGIAAAAYLLKEDAMPPMPDFVDFNKQPMKYDVCHYCKWREHGCKDYQQGDKLSMFAESVRSVCNAV